MKVNIVCSSFWCEEVSTFSVTVYPVPALLERERGVVVTLRYCDYCIGDAMESAFRLKDEGKASVDIRQP